MPLQMTTTFIDTVTGEEYEFLGTSIQFSEKELIALEQQHDQEIDSFVQQLIDDGYFEEEWEEEPEQENQTNHHPQINQQQQQQEIDQIEQIMAEKSYPNDIDLGETSNEETSESEIGPDETDDDEHDDDDEEEEEDDEEIVYDNKENKCINSKQSQLSYIVSTAYSKTTKKVDLSKFYSPSCSPLKKNAPSATRKNHLPLQPLQSMQININGICIRNIMVN